ncbi:hypothetical protein EI94DRAFT_1799181 [Lactarius quietus]|nr:hypothetical protein EI94DRAFT_1799181 [Lactarius quietus]
MASAPSAPVEIPPYQVQPLISNVLHGLDASDAVFTVETDIFSGSEIYAGCSNGDLLRLALQMNGPSEPTISVSPLHTVLMTTAQPGSYALAFRKTLPTRKSVEEIVLTPGISRAFVFSDPAAGF